MLRNRQTPRLTPPLSAAILEGINVKAINVKGVSVEDVSVHVSELRLHACLSELLGGTLPGAKESLVSAAFDLPPADMRDTRQEVLNTNQ